MVVSFFALVQGVLVRTLVVLEMHPQAANAQELPSWSLVPSACGALLLGLCKGLTALERNGNVQHGDCGIAVPTSTGK